MIAPSVRRLADADAVAFVHDEMLALRDQVLADHVRLLVADGDLDEALRADAEADDAFDLGDDGGVLGLARLEELGHARQAAGDVLGLRDFLRDLGHDVADVHGLLLGHEQDGVGRKREHRDLLAALLDDDARVEALRPPAPRSPRRVPAR